MKVYLVYAKHIETGEVKIRLGGGSSSPAKARVYESKARAEQHAPTFQPGRYDYKLNKYVRDPKWGMGIKEVEL